MQIEFEDTGQLQSWLASKQIDISGWGSGGRKSLAHLWNEYVNGEVIFQDEPPLRIVQAVQVLIRREDRVLMEVEQEFSDGERRSRQRPPSEKMKAGETYLEAAQRCLREELALGPGEIISILPGSFEQSPVLVVDSPSYPGLTTSYTIHTVEASVTGLPDSDFWLENRSVDDGDPIRRHRWSWRGASDETVSRRKPV